MDATIDVETIQLDLQVLADGSAPGLTPATGSMLAEAAAAAIVQNGGTVPARFDVAGADAASALISFRHPDDQVLRTHDDHDEATELGAVGLALTYLRVRHGELVVQRARKMTGIDYFVGPHRLLDGPPFAATARLEVTGFGSGDTDEALALRQRAKRKQIMQSDSIRLPAWIVYVRFRARQMHLDRVGSREAA